MGAALLIAAFALFLHFAAGAKADPEPSLHTVRPGETLWNIASENSSLTEDPRAAVEEMKDHNHLDGYTIYPGQVLELPD